MDTISAEIKLRKLGTSRPKIHAPSDFYSPSSNKLLLLVEGEYCFGWYVKSILNGKTVFHWVIEKRTGPWKITHWAYLPYPKNRKVGKEDVRKRKFKLEGMPATAQSSFDEEKVTRRSTKSARKRRNKKGVI